MPRFTLKQWRETFEEVIIEARDLEEAEALGNDYPDIDAPVEVVNEVESTLRVEVSPIETTAWIVQFDDPGKRFSAESEQFDVEVYADSVKDAKEKAIEWYCGLNDAPYHYPFDIPQCDGEWKAEVAPQTATLILTRDCAGGSWLTLIEIYQPR